MFDYRPGLGWEAPDDILKDFRGYLQTGGYSAYNDFDKRAGITLLYCMVAARRKIGYRTIVNCFFGMFRNLTS